jgi:hypothetical protein
VKNKEDANNIEEAARILQDVQVTLIHLFTEKKNNNKMQKG